MAKNRYPIVGFHFNVTFIGLPEAANLSLGFQSVSKLQVQTELVSLKEGGENRFLHSLPSSISYDPVVLKKGIVKAENKALLDWCQKAFQSNKKQPIKGLSIDVLDEQHKVLLRWHLHHVWPIRWSVGKLNAERGEVLIETLELKYNYFETVSMK